MDPGTHSLIFCFYVQRSSFSLEKNKKQTNFDQNLKNHFGFNLSHDVTGLGNKMHLQLQVNNSQLFCFFGKMLYSVLLVAHLQIAAWLAARLAATGC